MRLSGTAKAAQAWSVDRSLILSTLRQSPALVPNSSCRCSCFSNLSSPFRRLPPPAPPHGDPSPSLPLHICECTWTLASISTSTPAPPRGDPSPLVPLHLRDYTLDPSPSVPPLLIPTSKDNGDRDAALNPRPKDRCTQSLPQGPPPPIPAPRTAARWQIHLFLDVTITSLQEPATARLATTPYAILLPAISGKRKGCQHIATRGCLLCSRLGGDGAPRLGAALCW
jgi:hypothetical protein